MKRFTALPLAVLIACSASDPTTPANFAAIYGTWTLESVNGAPLPTATTTGTETLRSTLLAGDGSFTITSTVRAARSGADPETVVESGNIYCGHVGCRPQLLLFRESGTEADALVEGATLTITRPDLVQVFRRSTPP
jgi:hypothetical protein